MNLFSLTSAPAALLLAAFLVGCPSGPLGDDDDDDATAPETDGTEQPRVCGDVSPSLSADPDGGFRVETAHYRLFVRGMDEDEAETLGRMAETAWDAWQEYFPATFDLPPSDPFEAYVEASFADFAARIATDGLDPGDAGGGGYYHPDTRRAYLYAQPTVWYTRVLFLHELAHQAHRQSRGAVSVPGWYVEGLAEFLSRHDWDGECLRLGVTPHLSLEDPAEAALSSLDGLDVGSWFDQDAWPGRPLALEFLRLAETSADLVDGWTELRSLLDEGASVDSAVAEATLDLSMSALDERLRDFVPDDQEPLIPVYQEWLHRTPTSVRGWADGVLTLARHKVSPGPISLVSEPPSGGSVGLLMSWDSGSDYDAVVLSEDGELWTFNAVGGTNTWNYAGEIDPPAGPVNWALDHDADGALVTVNGEALSLPIGASPASGLAVNNDDIVFSELSWSP